MARNVSSNSKGRGAWSGTGSLGSDGIDSTGKDGSEKPFSSEVTGKGGKGGRGGRLTGSSLGGVACVCNSSSFARDGYSSVGVVDSWIVGESEADCECNVDVSDVGEGLASGTMGVSIGNAGAVERMGEVGGVMGVGIIRG